MNYPKPKSEKLISELNKYVIVEPYPFVVDLKSCKGMYIGTIDNDKIFDWTGLYGSKLIGYNHPKMFEQNYLTNLSFVANTKLANPDFLSPECLDYYRLLHSLSPKCMRDYKPEVYSVNSGAEAVENMMKYFIKLFQHKMDKKGKKVNNKRFIYFDQGFHGRTLFALNVTVLDHDPMLTKDFQGLVPGNFKIPFPAMDSDKTYEENLIVMNSALASLEYIMQTYSDEIAGLILEPIQGAGGHRIALPEFYTKLSLLCQKYDIAWGLDEVQTAGGQTGEFFSIDLFDIPYPPDAVASAKKLGNGVVYMKKPMEDIGVLDSTWGGTLSDMLRFVQEWKIVQEEKLLEQIEEKAKYLISKLKKLQEKFPNIIGNIRGLGIYQGFSLKKEGDKAKLVDLALENENLLLLAAGKDTIRLRPPLDMTMQDVDLLYEKLYNLFDKNF
ncbi:MAG: aminotransferase class III-fold pyridoxal phosphate-dependent enzyme [Bacteroidales bacterium]|jgi:L-lysine 6-transaminase|nr:aminotransferase class III-fold pyridoxal phosphate-dependent enzyme [Bacteroidales bacterium]NLB85819.1 aminotransferase class III-fold pyridoxal phosphate-dependent enzyme [Bacteroidales bacterium]